MFQFRAVPRDTNSLLPQEELSSLWGSRDFSSRAIKESTSCNSLVYAQVAAVVWCSKVDVSTKDELSCVCVRCISISFSTVHMESTSYGLSCSAWSQINGMCVTGVFDYSYICTTRFKADFQSGFAFVH